MKLKGSNVVGKLCGLNGVVGKKIGEGTFGIVYEVMLSVGITMAVKFLKHEASAEKEEQLRELCQMKPPNRCFKGWPKDYGRTSDGVLFYFMEKVEPTYRPMTRYLAGKVTLTWRSLFRAGFNLADAFAALHLAGLVFPDISSNQVLVRLDGDIAIVDCDNICFASAEIVKRGTRGYMTPKLESGDEPVSMSTDSYALSTLLFELLIVGNPLSGMKETTLTYVDDTKRDEWYKTKPVFVFSDSDDSTCPDPSTVEQVMIEHWNRLPIWLQNTFRLCFTEGLQDSSLCLHETEWRDYFGRLPDLLYECENCRKPLLYDPNASLRRCPCCKRTTTRPPLLHIYFDYGTAEQISCEVALGNDTWLYAHHMRRLRTFDFTPAARIVRGDRRNSKYVGLKNLTADVWRVHHRDGSWKYVEPNDIAPLFLGTTLYFSEALCVVA
jgi:LSD1 subclass zinc finger protein